MARAVLLMCALVLALTGCGGEDDGAGSGPRPGVSATLDPDNLALVHDELYVCLQREIPDALLASYLGGQASISDSYGRADFDARLAAPEAEVALIGGAVRSSSACARTPAAPGTAPSPSGTS